MLATTESNATTTLVLTPLECEALLQLLDQAIQRSHPVKRTNALLTALDKLDDDASIAKWLRENATTELTAHAISRGG